MTHHCKLWNKARTNLWELNEAGSNRKLSQYVNRLRSRTTFIFSSDRELEREKHKILKDPHSARRPSKSEEMTVPF